MTLQPWHSLPLALLVFPIGCGEPSSPSGVDFSSQVAAFTEQQQLFNLRRSLSSWIVMEDNEIAESQEDLLESWSQANATVRSTVERDIPVIFNFWIQQSIWGARCLFRHEILPKHGDYVEAKSLAEKQLGPVHSPSLFAQEPIFEQMVAQLIEIDEAGNVFTDDLFAEISKTYGVEIESVAEVILNPSIGGLGRTYFPLMHLVEYDSLGAVLDAAAIFHGEYDVEEWISDVAERARLVGAKDE